MLPCVCSVLRSQRASKCGKNISDTLGCASCGTFLFLPDFKLSRSSLMTFYSQGYHADLDSPVVLVVQDLPEKVE